MESIKAICLGFEFECPNCGQEIQIGDEFLPDTHECEECKDEFKLENY